MHIGQQKIRKLPAFFQLYPPEQHLNHFDWPLELLLLPQLRDLSRNPSRIWGSGDCRSFTVQVRAISARLISRVNYKWGMAIYLESTCMGAQLLHSTRSEGVTGSHHDIDIMLLKPVGNLQTARWENHMKILQLESINFYYYIC